jgi:hypothetical protein
MDNKSLKIFSIFLYIIGAVSTLFLGIMVTWAQFETTFYGFPTLNEDHSLPLSCPLVMTSHETSTITTTLENKTDREIRLLVRADISSSWRIRSEREFIRVPEGASQQVSWQVDVNDMDYGRFIMARVYQYASYKTTMKDAMCGIVMLDVPFLTGNQVLVILLVAGFGGLASGLFLWHRAHQPLEGIALTYFNALLFMAIVAGLGLILSLNYLWAPSALLFVVAILIPLQFLYIKK